MTGEDYPRAAAHIGGYSKGGGGRNFAHFDGGSERTGAPLPSRGVGNSDGGGDCGGSGDGSVSSSSVSSDSDLCPAGALDDLADGLGTLPTHSVNKAYKEETDKPPYSDLKDMRMQAPVTDPTPAVQRTVEREGAAPSSSRADCGLRQPPTGRLPAQPYGSPAATARPPRRPRRSPLHPARLAAPNGAQGTFGDPNERPNKRPHKLMRR